MDESVVTVHPNAASLKLYGNVKVARCSARRALRPSEARGNVNTVRLSSAMSVSSDWQECQRSDSSDNDALHVSTLSFV